MTASRALRKVLRQHQAGRQLFAEDAAERALVLFVPFDIQYGAASCPRTLDILSRFAGPAMHPKHTDQDIDDIIAAIRKVYPRIMA